MEALWYPGADLEQEFYAWQRHKSKAVNHVLWFAAVAQGDAHTLSPGRLVGLGVDLVELQRVERALGRWGERLIEKLMDPGEAACLPPEGPVRVHAVACAIAGKEAASKAIGTGWSRGVRWRDVVVTLGPPARVQLLARAAEVARRLGSDGSTAVELEERDGLVLGRVALLDRR